MQPRQFCIVSANNNSTPSAETENSSSPSLRRRRRSRAHIELAPDANSHLSVRRELFHSSGVKDDISKSELFCPQQTGADTNNASQRIGEAEAQQLLLPMETTVVPCTSLFPRCQHTDWEALREFRLQELNEMRQRFTQMENTMRWWLASAEQWREKWMAVKSERTRFREENGRLRNALSAANAEIRSLKHAKETKEQDCLKEVDEKVVQTKRQSDRRSTI